MRKNLFQPNSFRNKYQTLINQINEHEDHLKTLSDNELRAQSFQLQTQYQQTQDLESLISKSFALTREASVRTLGLRHFDVQLIGGLVLNNQKIAEMKTGEGKTLVATLPACLNALTKKGVHIVTVNDYLASRDQKTMGQIYRFLGLETGLIQDDMSKSQRKKNYQADITYVTNYEVTFDFLRDNMALNLTDVVLKPFNYCIIDEVDSILVDEARTPLIISGPVSRSTHKYDELKSPVDRLVHKQRNLVTKLVDEGQKRLEEHGINDYEGGKLLLTALRGMPKNKRLLKLFKEQG